MFFTDRRRAIAVGSIPGIDGADLTELFGRRLALDGAPQGAHVAAGEQVATVGIRGQATGPHLHLEVLAGRAACPAHRPTALARRPPHPPLATTFAA